MKLQSFTVVPSVPDSISPLLEMAHNMWFAWNRDARQLFVEIDARLWGECGKNPILFLSRVSWERLSEMADSKDYVEEVNRVYDRFKSYINGATWYEENHSAKSSGTVAYFSCEYGIHESLPIYSGGLGILSGDHLKSASDLGVPLVAVGLFYRQGYFRQGLDKEGRQLEFYPENDWFHIPVKLVKGDDGEPLKLSMLIGNQLVFFQVWKVMVGRVELYLLDTHVDENSIEVKAITKRLYDSNRKTRIQQEILLGMGGVIALHKMHIFPKVYHINEGHSAFLLLERAKELVETTTLDLKSALEVVKGTTVFTTHTPVPAGNERFTEDVVKEHLGAFVSELGLDWVEFMGLGRENPADYDEEFCMTVLALRLSGYCNGVSKLHGRVSRNMWKGLYSNLLENEIPIGHVTNGVHSRTWRSEAFEKLLCRYKREEDKDELGDFYLWKAIDYIPNSELWETHQTRKRGLIEYVRARVKSQLLRRGGEQGEFSQADQLLDPNALTIGFARRFAPYKRATLLLSDLERLKKILSDPDRPVQILFAGKAHPADTAGKQLIQNIFQSQKDGAFAGRIIFLEDYDMEMAKHLVKGVDVWLNTPNRPFEASGTSGMKAAMNGVLNLSVLDGWWDEAYFPEIGWAVGCHPDKSLYGGYGDDVDSKLLYHLIEDEVVPTFYERDHLGVPNDWVNMMKSSMKYCGENFNTHRMVKDYVEQYYFKAEAFDNRLLENEYHPARELSAWMEQVRESWGDVKVLDVQSLSGESVKKVGDKINVTARVGLGKLKPSDVTVELYCGLIRKDGEWDEFSRVEMTSNEVHEEGANYVGEYTCERGGGRYGYTVRVLPKNEHLTSVFMPNLVQWFE